MCGIGRATSRTDVKHRSEIREIQTSIPGFSPLFYETGARYGNERRT